MNKLFTILLITSLGIYLLAQPVWAKKAKAKPTPVPAEIETHWDAWWGMQYLQNGKQLTGQELRNLIDSTNDPKLSALLSQSGTDETLGGVGLGAVIGLNIACIFLPNTNVHVAGLNIGLPNLPVEIPAVVLGFASSYFAGAAGAEKYNAVQGYNRKVKEPGPLTWDLSPRSNGLVLDLKYAL